MPTGISIVAQLLPEAGIASSSRNALVLGSEYFNLDDIIGTSADGSLFDGFQCLPEFGTLLAIVVGKVGTDPMLMNLCERLCSESVRTGAVISGHIMATATGDGTPDGSVAFEFLDARTFTDALGRLRTGLRNITLMSVTLGARSLHVVVVAHATPSCIAAMRVANRGMVVVQVGKDTRHASTTLRDLTALTRQYDVDAGEPSLPPDARRAEAMLKGHCTTLARSAVFQRHLEGLVDMIARRGQDALIESGKEKALALQLAEAERRNRDCEATVGRLQLERDELARQLREANATLDALRNQAPPLEPQPVPSEPMSPILPEYVAPSPLKTTVTLASTGW